MCSAMPQSIPIHVDGEGIGSVQSISIPGKPYKITVDAYKEVGGTDSAPAPVVYALASLSSCTQITGFMVAKGQGISLGRWCIAVDGTLPDPKILERGGNPSFQSVHLKVRVQTSTSGGSEGHEFKQFTDEVESRCPMAGLFRRAVPSFQIEWENESL